MRRIKVTRRNGDVHFIKVDDADFEKVSAHKWCVKEGRLDTFYSVTRVKKQDGKSTTMQMHRFLLEPKKSEQVDHINHNGLDNRRANLRICTNSQNTANARVRRGSSKYRGVIWRIPHGKWCARCKVDGKRKLLGHFTDEEEAARACDKAALKAYGEFALVNFPIQRPIR